ncbi:hypothetical protein TNCV_864731 [Trichonephila clavipes]|nr:hypothetical protein TNCV_864731 [Trichonephila clavipes]
MPLLHHRRQYEQLLESERGKIIRMMEAGWSSRQVARQVGHSGLSHGSQEPLFNQTMLAHKQQGCHKTASTTLPPFPGLLDSLFRHQLSISGIIWEGKLDSLRVWSNWRRIYDTCGTRCRWILYGNSMPLSQCLLISYHADHNNSDREKETEFDDVSENKTEDESD